MANVQTPQFSIEQNRQARMILLGTGEPMKKKLGNFTGGTQGSTTRIKLNNVGITTALVLDVTATYDVGTAAVTLSPKAPYNMISRIKVTDYDGTDRVNCNGYHLWLINSVRDKTPYGLNNESLSSVLASPSSTLTVGSARTMNFQIEVPLAYDAKSDLRGALFSQTNVGEAYINIDWIGSMLANGNDDAVFNGSGTSTLANVSFAVTVSQEFIMPQQMDSQGRPIVPIADLGTVYELTNTVISSSDIAANAEKLINYPNNRAVLGMYTTFTNNGVLNDALTDMSNFRLISNGSTTLREYTPREKLFDQRLYMAAHADLKKGSYFELHRYKPVQTSDFGNIQYGFTPSTVSGSNTHFDTTFECFYPKGATLPGLAQSA